MLCGDSTSVQLFQTLVGLARLRPGRTELITDGAGFPTDQYIAESVARLLGLSLRRIAPAELPDVISDATARVRSPSKPTSATVSNAACSNAARRLPGSSSGWRSSRHQASLWESVIQQPFNQLID